MYHLTRYQYPRTASLFPSLAARSQLAGLESEIDRLFSAAPADFAPSASAPRLPVGLYENKESTYVRAELPGVSREAINVEMVDGYLTISAARKEGDDSFSLTRSVGIPEAAQADKVTAAYENGVLTVTLPKQEQAKPRKIAVS